MKSLSIHPVAAIFPEMTGAPFADLVADIKENGLRENILLHTDGSIVDGRNRYRACMEAGVEPKFTTWDGKGSLIALVLSLNLHRRHLDDSQRGMIAAKSIELFEDEAKKRQATSGPGQYGGKPLVPNLGQRVDAGKSSHKAAEMVGVSHGTVEAAAKVLKSGTPELVAAVEKGEVSVSAAATIAKLPTKEQKTVVAGGAKQVTKKASEIRRQPKMKCAAVGNLSAAAQSSRDFVAKMKTGNMAEAHGLLEKRAASPVAPAPSEPAPAAAAAAAPPPPAAPEQPSAPQKLVTQDDRLVSEWIANVYRAAVTNCPVPKDKLTGLIGRSDRQNELRRVNEFITTAIGS